MNLPFHFFRIFSHLVFAQDVASPFTAFVLPSSNGSAVSREGDKQVVILSIDDGAD